VHEAKRDGDRALFARRLDEFRTPPPAAPGAEQRVAAIAAALAPSPPDLALVVYKALAEYADRSFGDDSGLAIHDWLVERFAPVASFGRSPLEPGHGFGFAPLAPRGAQAQSAGSR